MSLNLPVCAEALFASDLQSSARPGADLVQVTVVDRLSQLGEQGCAAVVAQEFGEHPDCACRRMAWAIEAVSEAFEC